MDSMTNRILVSPPSDSVAYRHLIDAMLLGKTMVIVGILLFGCAIAEMALFDQLGWMPLDGGRLDYWSSILCILTGVVAFLAGRNMHQWLIASSLCLSVLTAAISLELVIQTIRRTVFFAGSEHIQYVCNNDRAMTRDCPNRIFALMVSSACTAPMAALVCALAVRTCLVCGRTIEFTASVAPPGNDSSSSAMTSIDIQN